ncbi:primase-helicase family protein [Enterobacter hormaechei]|uniref:primase-helicase family protein n=1 Tax=Enterobacter hormaechei TaxID=158836 RepID=UPI002574FB70|nr:primase-helicase family protein [Enterobacter hormaechei]WJJ26578.1 hypothetical protein N6139_14845 [Enterobacter hormaechei]WJJ31142.1 hypothetical protein N6136_13455 [Enterobacter hormaechei]
MHAHNNPAPRKRQPRRPIYFAWGTDGKSNVAHTARAASFKEFAGMLLDLCQSYAVPALKNVNRADSEQRAKAKSRLPWICAPMDFAISERGDGEPDLFTSLRKKALAQPRRTLHGDIDGITDAQLDALMQRIEGTGLSCIMQASTSDTHKGDGLRAGHIIFELSEAVGPLHMAHLYEHLGADLGLGLEWDLSLSRPAQILFLSDADLVLVEGKPLDVWQYGEPPEQSHRRTGISARVSDDLLEALHMAGKWSEDDNGFYLPALTHEYSCGHSSPTDLLIRLPGGGYDMITAASFHNTDKDLVKHAGLLLDARGYPEIGQLVAAANSQVGRIQTVQGAKVWDMGKTERSTVDNAGKIDDLKTQLKKATGAERRELKAAIAALESGKTPQPPRTELHELVGLEIGKALVGFGITDGYTPADKQGIYPATAEWGNLTRYGLNDDTLRRVLASTFYLLGKKMIVTMDSKGAVKLLERTSMSSLALEHGDLFKASDALRKLVGDHLNRKTKADKTKDDAKAADEAPARLEKAIGDVSKAINNVLLKVLEAKRQANRMRVEFDMFADQGSCELHVSGDGCAVYTRPVPLFNMPAPDAAIVDDYRDHWPDVDKFIDWLFRSRIASSGKQSFLWKNAVSNSGKTLLMGALKDELNIATELHLDDISRKGTLDGGRPAEEFAGKWLVVFDEIREFPAAMKHLDNSLRVTAKFQMTQEVRMHGKLIMSAFELEGLADGVESQIANRLSRLESSNVITSRPLFKERRGTAYRVNIARYIAQRLDAMIIAAREQGREAAVCEADRWLGEFLSNNSIVHAVGSQDDVLAEWAGDFAEWVRLEARDGNDTSIKAALKGDVLKRPQTAFAKWVENVFPKKQRSDIVRQWRSVLHAGGFEDYRTKNIIGMKIPPKGHK